jgi:phytoene/squalene synthetase
MCLKIFCEGDENLYQSLKPNAMSLGSAFQKINFLRDLKADFEGLGRTYFPGVDLNNFNAMAKHQVEVDIEKDFKHGLEGIKKLPYGSRFGVYMAYIYFHGLYKKIKRTSPIVILKKRVRLSNFSKYMMFVNSYLRYKLHIL